MNFEKGIINTESFIFKNAPSRARRLAKFGDTIISTVRTYLKAIDFVDQRKSSMVFSTGFAVLNPVKIDSKFLVNFVKSDAFTNQVDTFSTGMSYPAINSTDLGRLHVPLPPLPEQTAIANFLDRKTTQVDTAIRIKERQIELLKERRQILIHKAVTRGLHWDSSDERMTGLDNPKIQSSQKSQFRHSGVDWIGEIPAHWKVASNRSLFVERNEPGNQSLPILSVSIHTAVSSEELSDDENLRGKIRIEDKSSYKLVNVSDITFNMMRA